MSGPTGDQRERWRDLAHLFAEQAHRMATWIGPGSIALDLSSRDLASASDAIHSALDALVQAESQIRDLEAAASALIAKMSLTEETARRIYAQGRNILGSGAATKGEATDD